MSRIHCTSISSTHRRHATTVVAVASMIWYTFSISRYEYQKVLAWSCYPPLIGAVICKLLFPACTSPSPPPPPPAAQLTRLVAKLRRGCELFSPSACRVVQESHRTICSLLRKDSHGLAIGPAVLVAVLPCSVYLIHRVMTCDHVNHKSFANHIGVMGVIASSSLLYPVAKFSVLTRALNLSEINAIKVHTYAGVLAMFGGALHGIYYCVTWVLNRKTVQDLFPLTSECWTTLFNDMDMEGGDITKSHCCCKFVNITGLVAGVAFIILGLASLWKIRRRYYRLFYYTHVSMSIVALFCMVVHWRGTILFIAPGFLYYTASNMPVYVEGLYKSMWLKGVHITNIVCIPDSRGCIEISMKSMNQLMGSSSSSNTALQDSAVITIGKYVRLIVPEVSAKSHPFTIFSSPKRPTHNDITILFRPCGPFTVEVSRRIQEFFASPEPTESELSHFSHHVERKPPRILVNGIGYGTTNQLKDASRHETIIIIAGGVGIVSFISLIIALQSRAANVNIDMGQPRNMQVHWICRDEGLIDHVVRNHFAPLFEKTCSLLVCFTVHHTNEQSMKDCSKNEVYPSYFESDTTPSVAATPNSLYDYSCPTFLRSNVIPTGTMSSIILGGVLIFKHSYSKTYFASKPIALFELFCWAVLASVLSITLLILGETFATKLKLYTKLVMYNETVSELEFAEACTPQEQLHKTKVAADDVDKYDDTPRDVEASLDETPMGSRCCINAIKHKNGRPNMRTILTDAMTDVVKEDEDPKKDIGIFMCGPTVMMDAVRCAIDGLKKDEGKGKSLQTTVYSETFEM